MYQKELGLYGGDVKLALKTIHAWVGYVLVGNLIWRGILQLFHIGPRNKTQRAPLKGLLMYVLA